MGQRYADDLESQNDEHLEGLTAKVKLLKDVSICSLSPPWLAVSMRHSSMHIDYHWHRERGPRVDRPT